MSTTMYPHILAATSDNQEAMGTSAYEVPAYLKSSPLPYPAPQTSNKWIFNKINLSPTLPYTNAPSFRFRTSFPTCYVTLLAEGKLSHLRTSIYNCSIDPCIETNLSILKV